MRLSASLVSNYRNQGYAIVELPAYFSGKLSALRKKFLGLFSMFARAKGESSITRDEDIVRIYRSRKQDIWVPVYDQLRYLPEIASLMHSAYMLQIVKKLGLVYPALCARPIVRLDMPHDTEYEFPPHQDYPFNQGSQNSLTVWIPLQDTPTELGALRIVPSSHVNGLMPCKNGVLLSPNDAEYQSVPMMLGEVIVFSQFLHHCSGKNVMDDRVRFSVQIRFNDLADPEYIQRKYYINQRITEKNLDFGIFSQSAKQ